MIREATVPIDVFHIITPGDHYSPLTGSAIPSVVHGISPPLNQLGYRCHVVIDETTMSPRYETCNIIEVAYRLQPLSFNEKVYDSICGSILRRRPFINSKYQPVINALGCFQNGVVFYYNTISPSVSHKLSLPNHKVYSWWQNDLARTFSGTELKYCVEKLDGVICCSNYIRNRILMKIPKHLHSKIHVVMNGTNVLTNGDSARKRKLSSTPTVLYVGRVVPEKGVHILLDAFMSNHNLVSQCRLKIVGSRGFSSTDPLSQYELSLRRKAAELGEKVTFVPFVDRNEIIKIYQTADVLVVPSTFQEPFGLVVLEANSFGLPVVHSLSGGLSEASGGQGLCFDIGSVSQLSERIEYLVFDSEYHGLISRRSICWAQMQTWNDRAMSLAKLLPNKPVC